MTNKKPPQKKDTDNTDGGERIAKVLARAGICSRRDAERLIEERRVSVNGSVLETPAFKVTGREDIRVDGKPVGKPDATRMWLYHKPAGLVTSHRDEQGRDTIFDHLPKGMPRVISVGRLDLNSEGLLLLTNNGELSRHLELPATGWARTYRVRAFGDIDERGIDALARGMRVDGINYGPIEAHVTQKKGRNLWMVMTLYEGKNREIRQVLSALGLTVNRLIRTSYGPFALVDLKPEEVQEVPRDFLQKALGKDFKI